MQESDEQLVRALVRGDDDALATLYERWRRPLFAFCARMLGDAESARDAVQDVFLAVRQQRGTSLELVSCRAWLFTLARHRCLNVLRRRRSRDRFAPQVEPGPPPAGPDDLLHANEEAALVRSAVAALPDELREALVLREYLGLSYREIAVVTECSEGAIKTRIHRARRELLGRLHPLVHEGDDACRAKSRNEA